MSLAYLQRARVFLFERPDREEPVAGYVLNGCQPYRYREWVDPAHLTRGPGQPDVLAGDATEIACTWMARDLRPLERNLFYAALGWDCAALGRRFVVGATRVEKVARAHKLALPHTYYRGPAPCFDGEPVEIYYATLAQLALRLTVVLPLRQVRGAFGLANYW